MGRPTASIAIGSRTYTVRAPKYQVWWEAVHEIDKHEKAIVAAERLRAEGDSLSPEEADALAREADLTALFGQMAVALVYGIEDGGRLRGGFLRRALQEEAWLQVMAELDDEDSDLDLPDLLVAARTVQQEFMPWFLGRSEVMGLPVPESQSKPAARTRKS